MIGLCLTDLKLTRITGNIFLVLQLQLQVLELLGFPKQALSPLLLS